MDIIPRLCVQRCVQINRGRNIELIGMLLSILYKEENWRKINLIEAACMALISIVFDKAFCFLLFTFSLKNEIKAVIEQGRIINPPSPSLPLHSNLVHN